MYELVQFYNGFLTNSKYSRLCFALEAISSVKWIVFKNDDVIARSSGSVALSLERACHELS